ncbi:hypothetical protein B0H13DRAFT_1852968 [Mycena leptocephala]|nr:hypothetical protein B0H13DRAFT_1852968 [Mycena leptocephala]
MTNFLEMKGTKPRRVDEGRTKIREDRSETKKCSAAWSKFKNNNLTVEWRFGHLDGFQWSVGASDIIWQLSELGLTRIKFDSNTRRRQLVAACAEASRRRLAQHKDPQTGFSVVAWLNLAQEGGTEPRVKGY